MRVDEAGRFSRYGELLEGGEGRLDSILDLSEWVEMRRKREETSAVARAGRGGEGGREAV